MKIKYIILVMLVLTLSFAGGDLSGQVTIGSEQPPEYGTLLDLKMNGTTTKGLALPRVEITDINKLKIGSAAELTGIEQINHAGLIVYNIKETMFDPCVDSKNIHQGLFLWTGRKWTQISPSKPAEVFDALLQPNSYLVKDGSRTAVKIPVEKAFAIWEYYGRTDIGRLPQETFTGPFTAKVHWQDANVVSYVTVSGTDRKATINVTPTGTYGNAVVVLKDSNGIIRWSWHIWATPDPTANASLTGNGYQWMDRYLGATSNAITDFASLGLHYQWGRKDPFPVPRTIDPTATPTEPVLIGEKTAVDKSYSATANTKNNLKYSIANPVSFIKGVAGNYDWYLSAGGTSKTRWDDRWAKNECGVEGKTPFDPCPEGWRVPAWKNSKSPWDGIFSFGALEWQTKWGYDWTDFGFYHFTGARHDMTGDLQLFVHSGSSANGAIFAWSATPNGSSAYNIAGARTTLNTAASQTRAFSYAVRCVKE